MKKLVLTSLFSIYTGWMLQAFSPVSFQESMEWKRDSIETNFLQDVSVQKAEASFLEFCEKKKGLSSIDYAIPPGNYSIPPVIHFIWLGSSLPQSAKESIESWEQQHPGWEVKLWMDQEAAHFPWTNQHVQSVFEQADSWAEKSDILRLDILYQWGGIYSDTDVLCLQPFHDLIAQNISFFSCYELNYTSRHYGEPFYVGTAILGAKKGSHVVKYCLDHCKTKSEAPDLGILKRTGPGLVSKACQATLDDPQEHLLILPCSYFYPLPWKLREKSKGDFISPESLAIHLWDNSWMKKK